MLLESYWLLENHFKILFKSTRIKRETFKKNFKGIFKKIFEKKKVYRGCVSRIVNFERFMIQKRFIKNEK